MNIPFDLTILNVYSETTDLSIEKVCAWRYTMQGVGMEDWTKNIISVIMLSAQELRRGMGPEVS